MEKKSNILKYALFATGLSGIVAEYILSTLATYFLGDSVFQWTIIVSIMLFSMGLGSRVSKFVDENLLEKFIFTEFLLSILASFSSIFVYYIATFTEAKAFFIYLLSACIGFLIGLEIPLVARMNEAFEELKVNIALVLEKDYYGSLIGGIFFAFFGLPYLGLTYTPFVLGFVNLFVAILVLVKLRDMITKSRKLLYFTGIIVSVLIICGAIFAKPMIFFSEQQKYKDKIIFEKQTRYQKLVVTKWQNDYWLYINGNLQFSSFDEWLYHEPLVHPVMGLSANPERILILGGGDGCAAREVLKYKSVKKIVLVDLDPEMTKLAITDIHLREINKNSMHDSRLNVVNEDAFNFVEISNERFDIIIIDLPDPKSVDLGRLYSKEFYINCGRILTHDGFVVTQATSPYYSSKAFHCINVTMKAADFNTVRLHNQVLTMGEWGWVIGSKNVKEIDMLRLIREKEMEVSTKWLNKEAKNLITLFGKPAFDSDISVEVNTLLNPVLPKYYEEGVWSLF